MIYYTTLCILFVLFQLGMLAAAITSSTDAHGKSSLHSGLCWPAWLCSLVCFPSSPKTTADRLLLHDMHERLFITLQECHWDGKTWHCKDIPAEVEVA
jgi:hypothetical protein